MAQAKEPGVGSSRFHRELVPVTLDQLQLANKIAHAAATGLMPRQSFSSKFEEAIDSGELEPSNYLVLSDLPVNHAAFAIMETFPEKTQAGDRVRQSLLYRVIFAGPAVYADPRAQKYLMKNKDGEWIGYPLLEALAITPMTMGDETPVDQIFDTAERIAAERDWDNDTEDRFHD